MSDPSPARILVIDDNLAIHEDFRKLLVPETGATSSYDQAASSLFRRKAKQNQGTVLTVEFAAQGQEGLACAQRALLAGQPFAMAFVDMRMPPGWDGLETIVQLWRVQPDLLIVICTAFADYAWEEINQRLGKSDRVLILKKPFDNIEVRQLAQALTVRSRVERDLAATQKQLLDASRLAGMAEVATAVLHNVGNVLNSVNTSVSCVCSRLHQSRVGLLRKSAGLLAQHRNDPTFLTTNPKGQVLPSFLEKLSDHLEKENDDLRSEMELVLENVEHINQIISSQQSYGRVSTLIEACDVRAVVEDAVRFNTESMARHRIVIEQEFTSVRPAQCDQHKAVQILVNLLRNAKQAIIEANPLDRRIRIRVAESAQGFIAVEVADTGVGICPENLDKIFRHGFTTKKDGHGFGLHTSILAAREMKGNLTVQSGGAGRGAAFTLELPTIPQP